MEIPRMRSAGMVLAAATMIGGSAWYANAIHAPKMASDSQFGGAMLVVYPFTQYMLVDKINNQAVGCTFRECRAPAVLVDTQGRTATIWVNGSSEPGAAISPDGRHVLLNDREQFHRFSNGVFTTQVRKQPLHYPNLITIGNDGDALTIADGEVQETGETRTRTMVVEHSGSDYAFSIEPLDGQVMHCDGRTVVEHRNTIDEHQDITQTMVYSPTQHRFEPGVQYEEFKDKTITGYQCVGDGAGTALLSVAIDTPLMGDVTDYETINHQQVFYIKRIDQAPEPISPVFSTQDQLREPMPNGFYMTQERAWMVTRSGEVYRFDFATNQVTPIWSVPLDPALNGDITSMTTRLTDQHLIIMGELTGEQGRIGAQVYDLETGTPVMRKELPTLSRILSNTWIDHMVINDPNILLDWIRTKPNSP